MGVYGDMMEHALLEVGLPESYIYVTFDDIKRLYNLAGADLDACSTAATWEVDVAGRRYPARASLRPMYDPKNEKIKA